MCCAVWETCNFIKSNTPPWVFFTLFKLYKWNQIAQLFTYTETDKIARVANELQLSYLHEKSDWNRAKNYWYKYKLLKTHKCQLGRHNVCRHCVKTVRIRSYSGPYFPAFGLNTERYGLSLRIQSECSKIRTRLTLNTDTFLAVRVYRGSCLVVIFS